MSGYAVVMIVWTTIDSSLDHGTRGSENPHVSEDRLIEIQKAYPYDNWILGRTRIMPGCGDLDDLGPACEFVAVAHINHADAEAILKVMSQYQWEYPDEAAVMWKSDEMDRYAYRSVSMYRADKEGI
jgi:hypothetical protein